MKIVATKCTGRDLRSGDLFSTVGPEYWDHCVDNGSIGERVYIRTDARTENAPDADEAIYRIVIKTDTIDMCGFCHEPLTGGPRCSHCGALRKAEGK